MRFQSFILLLGAFFVLPAWARICEFGWSSSIFREESAFKNQEDVDTRLKDCTTISGGLQVSPQYEGSFVVNGVTNMTGRLNIFSCPGVTEIVWNDLEVITNLYISNNTALRSMYLPKLATASDISITSNQRLDLDLPVLTYAAEVNLKGAITRFNAPLLVNVSLIRVDLEQLSYDVFERIDAFNFSLPSLEYVGARITLKSNLSDIVLPKLKVIAGSEAEFSYYAVQDWGTSEIHPNPVLNISLPSLVSAKELDIMYDQSISLPLLEQVLDLELQGNSSKVILPALWNGTRITVYGKVTDVSFPALNQTNVINVYGIGPTKTNCTSVTSDWERTNTTERHLIAATCISYYDACAKFRCEWTNPNPPKEFKPLNSGAISGICAGVAVILVLILITFSRWRESEKVKKAKEAAEAREREIEMDGLTIIGDRESVAEIVEDVAAGRRDSKDTVVVVVGVEESDINGQRSGMM